MSLKTEIRPVTFLKNRTAELLDQINETHAPVIITQSGEARAVLQDPESYERTQNALLMLKLLARGEADVRTGRVISQDEVFRKLRKRVKARLKDGKKSGKL